MESLPPLLITELRAGEVAVPASSYGGLEGRVASAVTFSFSSSWISVLEGQR